jgi:pilus assembly protein CpaB
MLARNILLAIGTLAVVIGVVLAFVWLRASSSDAETKAVVVEPAVAILVAARPLPVGTLLRVQDLTWSDVPAAAATSANFVRGKASEADFAGSVTRVPLHEHEALVADAFVKPGDRDFLVAALAPGYRAVSIGVDAAQSGSGLMLPGDRVDVVLTQTFNVQGPSDPGRRSVGETVLHDLRIIAVDQRVSTSPNVSDVKLAVGADMQIPRTITLEVLESQAQMLLVSQQLGKIQLTLRGQQPGGGGPAAIDEVPPTWASDVSPALKTLQNVAPTVNNGQGPIEVIHGAKSERVCPTGSGFVTCP